MTTVVEARGVLCPVPIIRLARTARSLGAGDLVEVLTDDPAADLDIPAWCRLRGHKVLSVQTLPDPHPPGAARPEPAPPEPDLPEPDAPNAAPGQAVRHLIRLGPAGGGPAASTGGSVIRPGSNPR